MISLVMSTYNGQNYIEQQLESIRIQTLSPEEVIIRDDCSSDGTVNVIKEYIKKNNLNWKFESNHTNIGYKENFYRGVYQTSGDFIFLCDQDDIWNPEKIEIMVNVLKKHPEIWTLNCGVELINEDNKRLEYACEKGWQNANFLFAPVPLPMLQFFELPYILRHNITPGCAMVIDRRTRDGFLKLYDYGLPHDWYMNIIASANNGCAFLNQDLLFYRRHSLNAIGANTGVLKGIKSKTREVRIADYQSRIDGCKAVCKYYDIGTPDMKLFEEMISFYVNPTPIKLLKIRRMKEYRELAKRKVKLWELMVAFNIDGIIKTIVGFKR